MIAAIRENRDERGGSCDRIVVVLRELGRIVMNVEKFLTVKNFATIVPI